MATVGVKGLKTLIGHSNRSPASGRSNNGRVMVNHVVDEFCVIITSARNARYQMYCTICWLFYHVTWQISSLLADSSGRRRAFLFVVVVYVKRYLRPSCPDYVLYC